MGLQITVLADAQLVAEVQGNAILATIVTKSATLNIDVGVPGAAATVQVGTTTGLPWHGRKCGQCRDNVLGNIGLHNPSWCKWCEGR
jgi:hypothetical protein